MMMLFVTFLLSTVIDFTSATNFYPRPFSPRRMSARHGQVGLLRLGPMSPRIPPMIPLAKNVVWTKKFDPRTGAWVKLMKEKRPVLSPAVHHHYAKKAHLARKMRMMNKIVRTRNLARINTIRGGLLSVARQRDYPRSSGGPRRGESYHRYNRKPKRMIKIRPRTSSVGILGQGITRPPMSFRPFLGRRRPPLGGNIHVRRRIDDGNDFYDDFRDNDLNDFEDFREIDDSFDDRFDRGFRDSYPLLNARSDLMRAGAGGNQVPVQQNLVPKPINPSFGSGVAGFPRDDHFSDSVTGRDIHTTGIGGSHTSTFEPTGKIRDNLDSAILGSFDGKRDVPFTGTQNMGSVPFSGQPGIGDAGMFRSQRNGFGVATGSVTNGILDTSATSVPVGNIGLPATEFIGLGGDDRLPDGLLDGFDDIEDLSRVENRIDIVTDELKHLNDRLNRNERLDLDDRFVLDEKLNNQLDFQNRIDNTLTSLAPVQGGFNNEVLDRPHIAKAIGGFDRDNRDNRDHEGDIGLLGHDESPIDGLELLGPSRWGDIITEITNAAKHNQIFDQVAQESVPVFPVNPHASAESSKSGGSDVTANRNNGLGVGSLALLGIDPGTVTSADGHPPPIPLPKTIETAIKNSLDSLTTSKTVAITGGDDSTQTVITVETSNNGMPGVSTSGKNVRAPTTDIISAAKQFDMLGALDNLDFGNDSFDDDLRI